MNNILARSFLCRRTARHLLPRPVVNNAVWSCMRVGMSTKTTKLKEMVNQFVSDRKNDEWKMADQGRHCAQSASLGDYEASADPPELVHQEFEDVKARGAVLINLSYPYNGGESKTGRLYFLLLFFLWSPGIP